MYHLWWYADVRTLLYCNLSGSWPEYSGVHTAGKAEGHSESGPRAVTPSQTSLTEAPVLDLFVVSSG